MAKFATEIMTVREMIDAAVIFNKDKPIVDAKMLETILFLIARKLYVLNRTVEIRYIELNQAQQLLKSKPKIRVTEIVMHGRADKRTQCFTTKPMMMMMTSTKKYYNRTSSRPKSKDKTGVEKLKEYSSSQDVIYEKILEVSTTSEKNQSGHFSSVVTQEQYIKLLEDVHKLQAKFGIMPNMGTSSTNLRKPTSATDPEAALNIATRLDVLFKSLNEMMAMIATLASSKPGIDLDESFYDKFQFINPSIKDIPIPASSTTATSELQLKNVCVYTVTDIKDKDNLKQKIDEKNLATWTELNIGMDDIRNDILGLSKAVNVTTATATEALTLFTKSEPELLDATLVSSRLPGLESLIDRFAKKVNILDVEMTTQVSNCEKEASSLELNVTAFLERIEDYIATPLEDRAAVAALNEDITYTQLSLDDAVRAQKALRKVQEKCNADFKMTQNIIERTARDKTTREEILEILQNKVSVADINRIVSKEHLYAVVEYLYKEIRQTKEFIESGETNWQIKIDNYISYLNEKCDYMALITLNRSLWGYYISMSEKVNTMFNIVGDYELTIYKKKLDRDGNCLSCGTPAVVKVSDKYIKFARGAFNRQNVVMTQEDEITRQPCIPGQPILHPLDPRALFCHRYCGASVSSAERSLSLPGLKVIDINLTNMTGMQNKVHVTCSLCTKSE